VRVFFLLIVKASLKIFTLHCEKIML
jgi:hypothetical protein